MVIKPHFNNFSLSTLLEERNANIAFLLFFSLWDNMQDSKEPKVESMFSLIFWKSCNQILLAFKVRFPGNF